MRTTKSLTVSLPPAQLREMERIAKKENRTMSELVRESFRRYQQPPAFFDLREYIKQIAPTPPAFQAIRAEAKRKGSDKLTMAQIDREVATVRRRAGQKKTKQQR